MEIKPGQSENTPEIKSSNKKENGLANQIFQKIKEAKTDEEQKNLANELAVWIKDEQKISIAKGKLAESWKENAYTDKLTGLLNRAYAEKSLERETKNARRYPPLSILSADVNKLKPLNDVKGHDFGDEALKSIAKAIRLGIRDSDFPIRWGGDEFLVILPHSSKEDAVLVAQRILDNIKEAPPIAGENLSISIGISQLRKNEETGHFLKRADDALYEAKRNKKEFVVAND